MPLLGCVGKVKLVVSDNMQIALVSKGVASLREMLQFKSMPVVIFVTDESIFFWGVRHAM